MKEACNTRGTYENRMRYFNQNIQGKKPFGIHRCRWENTIYIKIDLEVQFERCGLYSVDSEWDPVTGSYNVLINFEVP
jgi:hypothetical protein